MLYNYAVVLVVVGGGGEFCLFLIGRGHNRFACLFFLHQRGRKRI